MCLCDMIFADGGGGKRTWGKLLDTDDGDGCIDKNDPNYDSGEVFALFVLCLLDTCFFRNCI